MFCANCGAQVEDGTTFCPSCGMKLSKTTDASKKTPIGASYFDGGLFQLLGYRILGGLVTILTLGLCLPWAFTMIYSWEAKHTVINGERLHFDGIAIGLFGNWIKWLLLTIITFGIYGFWVEIKLRKWRVEHTHTASGAAVSCFDGGLLQLIGYRILGVLVTCLTLGICLPWAFTMIYNWEAKHTVIDGYRVSFDGSAVGLFGNWIKWLLLSIITFGIYSFWVEIKLMKWKVSHMSF